MEKRQQKIFNLIVEEYIRTAEPIGSQILVRKCHLNYSPATVRNEMAELEEKGYLFQPHTSAGRVPTDKGYRFYVNQAPIAGGKRIKENKVENRFKEANNIFQEAGPRGFAKEISKMISEFSNNVGICGFLEDNEFYSAGLSNLLSAPEFDNNSEIKNFLGIFDYLDQEIKNVFSEMEKDMEVFIGKENKGKKFNDFSLVISKCQAKKDKKAVLGILGPKRMDYNQNIALIDLLRELIINN